MQTVTSVDLYTEYVRLRQSGTSRSDAVRKLQPKALVLSTVERQRLGELVQTWEGRDGKAYQTASTAQESETTPVKPYVESLDEVAQIQCEICGKFNKAQEPYCYSCGQVLKPSETSVSTRTFAGSEGELIRQTIATYFSYDSTLVLAIRGATVPLEFEPSDEVVLGRVVEGSAVDPDIDLTAYSAEEYGVSRLHAMLRRGEDILTITDLNSKNCTYINGQRLHPHEVRVLRNGDEVRLGRLAIKFGFKHALRPPQMRE